MKQRLLSFLAIAAMSCVAMAQTTWTPPAFDVSKGTELTSSETDRVYLYNVGAGQFLIGGTAWGTHAALGTGLPIRLTSTTTSDEVTYWQIYFFEGSKNKRLLFNDNGSDCYIDLNNQAVTKSYWAITKVGDFYRIQSFSTAISDPSAFDDTQYLGNSLLRDDYDSSNKIIDGSHIGVFCNFTADDEDANIDWLIVPEAAYNEYNSVVSLKKKLLSIINTIEELGIDVDQKFIDLLNDNNVSAADVEGAIADIKPSFIDTASKIASEDDPINVTPIFIVNPDFDGKSTSGWTLTGEYAKTQNNSPHPIEEGEGIDEEGLDTGGWLEFWNSGGIDKFQDAHQVVEDLPAGSYRLQLVGIGKGGKLYAITNGIRQENTIPSQKVQRLNFDFVHVGGDLTLGFDFTPASSGNPAWVAVDKFRLYYLGVGESPTIIMMRKALEALEPYKLKEDSKLIGSALYGQMEELISKAEGLISNNSEDEELNTSVIAEIQAMADVVAAEANAYVNLTNFKTSTLPSDILRFQLLAEKSSAYAALYSKITDEWEDALASALDDFLWNKEQIDEFLSAYNEAVEKAAAAYKAEIQQALDEAASKVAAGEQLSAPLDITPLFSSLTFPNELVTHAENNKDKYGWNRTESHKFNDNDGLKFEAHTAEGWSSIFDANTIVKNLPAGKYTVKVNAFYRPMSADLYDEKYDGSDLAFFYVNNGFSTTQKPILNWDALLEYFPKTIDGEEKEVDNRPNKQTDANKLFTAGNEASQKTAIEISTILREAGDLTIGAKDIEGVESNCWVVWSEITLLYVGAFDASVLNDNIQVLIDTANDLKDNGDGSENLFIIAKDVISGIDSAVETGQEALDNDDNEVKKTAIAQLESAIGLSQKNLQVTADLFELFTQRQTDLNNLSDYNFDNGSYSDMMDEIDECFNSTMEFESHEQMVTYLNRLKDEWFPFLLSRSDMADANEEEPADMSSMLISNATFDNSKDGWTLIEEGKAGTDADNCAEYWNTTAFDMYQELPMLKDGYWRLSVDAFYRYGNPEDDIKAVADGTYQNNEFFYINNLAINVMDWHNTKDGAFESTGEEGETAPFEGANKYTVTPAEGEAYSFWATNNKAGFQNVIGEKGDRYHNVITFAYGDGIEGALNGSVKFGLRKAEKLIEKDWCPFDNFKLEYLGTEKPENEPVMDGIAGTVTKATTSISSIFSIDGRQQSQIRRGINIVRTTDGKVSKVLVK